MAQGTYTFAGITHPKSGIYSQSHGTDPDRIVLTFTAQVANIAAGGTVTFSYDGTSIILPNCKVDQGVFQFNEKGFIEKAILFDRRWQWRQYAKVSLHFNETLPDNKTIRPATEKTPQEMLAALFDLIGEGTADVSAVPNTSRPEVAVMCHDVVDVIDDLCDRLGCRVVLGYDTDVVTVVPRGTGTALPNDATVSRVSVSWDPPEVPRYIQVRFAPTLFQSRFTTEPVGWETEANDGEIKPIGSLSYLPAGGWGGYANIDTFEDLATAEEIQRARASVWRWFRITDGPYSGTSRIPGYEHPETASTTVDEKFQILPVSAHRAVSFTSGELSQQLQAGAWGEVYVDEAEANDFVDPPPGENTDKLQELPIRFHVDGSNGIIKFSREVRKVLGGQNVDPDITVEVAHSVRNDVTWELDSYEKTIEVTPGGFGTITLCASDRRVVLGEYDASHNYTGYSDNVTELDVKAAQIASDFTAQLTAYESYVVHYNQLRPTIKPTGKVYQVTHIVSDRTGAVTVAGQHMEWDTGARTYIEKRRVRSTDNASEIFKRLEIKQVRETIRDSPAV
jgi:hypothetical protein